MINIRSIFYKLALIVGVGLGAFTVANVSADTPHSLPDLSQQCVDEETMACTGAGGTCRIVCEYNEWKLCSTDSRGDTIFEGQYICNSENYWLKCTADNDGGTVEGKVCASDQWGTEEAIPEEILCGNGTLDSEETCDGAEHCSSTLCQCDTGYVAEDGECYPIDPSTCGDNTLNPGEECDGGTSCNNATCECTGTQIPLLGSTPPGCRAATIIDLCGNGVRDSGEQCDSSGQYCNDSCQCDPGFISISGTSINCQAQNNNSGSGSGSGSGSTKQCNDRRDNDNDGKKDYPADPGCESRNDNSEIDPPVGALRILTAEVFPIGFNPTITDTKVTYKISGDGFVKLDILDESGVKIVTLLNNEETEKNKSENISWDGTDKAEGDGKIVEPGKYFFKLMAKLSASSAISDTKTGEINVIYASDFESVSNPGNGGSNTNASINNVPIKETSGTGPETMVYLILPVIGYFVARRLTY
ncbi:MAG: hypothetical protein WC285_03770 [Candidatus Gracilibacteria bacterium]|jgi:hypothetical protein